MPSLLEWTLGVIREEPSDFSWMEEHRYDWVPLAKGVLERIVDGQAVLLLTDPQRRWFERYILNAVNAPNKERPFLPIHSLGSLFPHLQEIDTNERVALLEDMLEIAYPQGHLVWYIGEGNHPYTKIAYRNEENFLWLINEELSGSFVLRDTDPLLDIKLLQLYRLFDKSIEATLYGQVELS